LPHHMIVMLYMHYVVSFSS